MPRALPALLTAAVLALAACGGSDEEAIAPTPDDVATTAVGAEVPEGCEPVQPPPAKPDGGAQEPSGEVTETTTVTFDTSCGAFTVDLDTENAPKTAQSFASLARQGFYDGTPFHRIVPGFVIQGGDPTGTGTGGPGYSVEEAPPEGTRYTRGVVAMAKTGAEPAGTSGSQFFVVTGDNTPLPPDYAVVGEVTSGMDAVQRIESVPTSGEQPLAPVVIQDAQVSG